MSIGNVSSRMEVNHKIKLIGQYGASLSLIEVGLGSLLHSFHIPFTGIFLSLNQGYILCRASLLAKKELLLTESEFLPYTVSNVAAFLKSLSPAGKKLGPMLSLSMQGLLFNVGTGFFGINFLGLLFGMLLLSLWSFVQPLLTYYFFFGKNLIESADYLFKKTIPFLGLNYSNLIALFLLVVVIKMTLASLLTLLAIKLPGNKLYTNELEEKLLSLAKSKKTVPDSSPLRGTLKDMTKPLFLISIFITALFLYFSENSLGKIIWYLMRPVALGFLFFYFSRTLTLDHYLLKMKGGKFDSFSRSLEVALQNVRKVI